MQKASSLDREGQRAMPDPQLLAEPLLNANDAARLLKVPRSTLYELVRSRGLPHVRIGRTLRFTRRDLGLWITDNTCGGSRDDLTVGARPKA
jgi:excisionase family DNA binding protein